jgi:hypothetical protein
MYTAVAVNSVNNNEFFVVFVERSVVELLQITVYFALECIFSK